MTIHHDLPTCTMVHPHPPHRWSLGGRLYECDGRSIDEPEEQMIEPDDFLASDALRMAVDLHGQKYRYEDITDEKVLETAEAFYQWLKAKQDRADKAEQSAEQSKEQYRRYQEMEPDRPDSTMYPIKREQQ